MTFCDAMSIQTTTSCRFPTTIVFPSGDQVIVMFCPCVSTTLVGLPSANGVRGSSRRKGREDARRMSLRGASAVYKELRREKRTRSTRHDRFLGARETVSCAQSSQDWLPPSRSTSLHLPSSSSYSTLISSRIHPVVPPPTSTLLLLPPAPRQQQPQANSPAPVVALQLAKCSG